MDIKDSLATETGNAPTKGVVLKTMRYRDRRVFTEPKKGGVRVGKKLLDAAGVISVRVGSCDG